MSAGAIVDCVFSLAHGLAAGLGSMALLSVAGLVLLPRRWASLGGTAPAVVGTAFYLAACWTAMGQRDIPLNYVIPLFAAVVTAIAILRFRSLTPALRPHLSAWARSGTSAFCILYVLVYLLILPPSSDALLPLAPAGNLDLVTHARYARHALLLGTPVDLDLAAFGYRQSPAGSYLIAWHSTFFGRDPLTAAMPALLAVSAAFGMVAVDLLRSLGLSRRVSLAIGCVVLSGSACRWVISAYGLPALLGATAVLLLIAAILAVLRRDSPGLPGLASLASCLLLFFAEPLSTDWIASTVRESGRVLRTVSPLSLIGWPGRIAQVRSSDVTQAAVLLLPLAVGVWAALAHVVRRSTVGGGLMKSDTDRSLARALAAYVMVALVIGNVAVDAVRDPGPARVTAAWRGLDETNQLPFRGLTLKMSDEPQGLSTAIALYFLPTKRVTVIGPDVDDSQLRFDTISRQTPIFIHNLGCAAAGSGDTITVRGIGCLLLSPPGAAVGTPYAFNTRYVFLSYAALTARTPQGRFNTRPTVPLSVTADPERARLDRDLFLNVLLDPLLPAGAKPQLAVFRWGGGRRVETSIAQRTWVSVPLRSQDWSGNRLWTVVVNIDFPDGRAVLFHALSVTETPQMAAGSGESATTLRR